MHVIKFCVLNSKLFFFCSFDPKFKHPDHEAKGKPHKVCILQRTTKDDGVDGFDAEFSMAYHNPFTHHWYNGEEGQNRLLVARNELQHRCRVQQEDLELLLALV
jgi:hypothetical protein